MVRIEFTIYHCNYSETGEIVDTETNCSFPSEKDADKYCKVRTKESKDGWYIYYERRYIDNLDEALEYERRCDQIMDEFNISLDMAETQKHMVALGIEYGLLDKDDVDDMIAE